MSHRAWDSSAFSLKRHYFSFITGSFPPTYNANLFFSSSKNRACDSPCGNCHVSVCVCTAAVFQAAPPLSECSVCDVHLHPSLRAQRCWARGWGLGGLTSPDSTERLPGRLSDSARPGFSPCLSGTLLFQSHRLLLASSASKWKTLERLQFELLSSSHPLIALVSWSILCCCVKIPETG